MSFTSPAISVPFRVGGAVSRSFSVFGAASGRFFVLALIPLLPVLMLDLSADAAPGAARGLTTLSSFLNLALGALANGTCLFGAYQVMRNRPFTIGASLSVASGRLASLIGASLLSTILIVLATLLLIVPGVIAYCMFFVALPACVVERLGATKCLVRSRTLTEGFRWPIFWLLILVAGLGAVVVVIVGIVAGFMVGASGAPDWVLTVLIFLATVGAQAYGAVLSAVVYHDLRVAKEGVDIESLANVFA